MIIHAIYLYLQPEKAKRRAIMVPENYGYVEFELPDETCANCGHRWVAFHIGELASAIFTITGLKLQDFIHAMIG